MTRRPVFSPRNMNETAIRDRLVEHGQTLFRAPRDLIQFTRDPDANALLNGLAAHPHAFVLACVMDRQIKAEKAWLIPLRFSERLGGFSMKALIGLSPADVEGLMSKPEKIHRFVPTMSKLFWSAIQRIGRHYEGE